MGLLIIGIVICLLGLFAVIGAEEGGAALIAVLGVLLICASFGIAGTEVSTEMTGVDMMIPVNGYYVDPAGNYVTASNLRGTLFHIPPVKESSLKSPPFIITETTHYKKNFWALKDSTDTSYKMSFEDLPLVK